MKYIFKLFLITAFLYPLITQGHPHMTSPAQKHFDKVTSAEESKKAGLDNTIDPQRSRYELMLGKMAQDKKRLGSIQSIAKKEQIKVTLVKEYDDYLDGVLASDADVQDDVVTQLMLWNIDAGDYSRATQLGLYAIEHDITMPATHKRETVVALLGELSERLLKGDVETLEDNQNIIYTLVELTEKHDIPDQVTANLHKAVGIINEKSNPQVALENYQKSLVLNDRIGVKGIIKKLEKKLTEEAATATTDINDGESGEDKHLAIAKVIVDKGLTLDSVKTDDFEQALNVTAEDIALAGILVTDYYKNDKQWGVTSAS